MTPRTRRTGRKLLGGQPERLARSSMPSGCEGNKNAWPATRDRATRHHGTTQ